MNKMATVVIIFCTIMTCALLADLPLPQLEEKVTYSAKGSKSESSHHYLLVNEKAIPDTFNLVWQEGRLYRFHTRQHMWGTDGYAPVKEDGFKITSSDKKITDTDTQRKWYLGKARLDGTPDHWVYVEWRDGAAFVDPIAMNTLAEELKLPILRRSEMEDYFKDK